ncbi:MAG: hypothetical protein PHD48_08740 [Alphaproteobacteria bacterium]|nr:hypothetical protein [Alphaproteobacteria bacterium]
MAGHRFLRLVVLSVSLWAVAGPSFAQQTFLPLYNLGTQPPDTGSVPILNNLVKAGATLHYLGERSGMFGWFIIKSGQIQMIYLTPDRRTAFVGGMFSADGDNVTSKQVSQLVERNSEVKALLEKSSRQDRGTPKVESQQRAATASSNGLPPSVSLSSPGERFLEDLKAAAGVVLGHNDQAEIQMIVAPRCPNCKKTWRELRDHVKSGAVQVRLIPVFNSTGDDEKNMAAQLLRVADPLSVWDRFVEGDAQALSGTPEPIAVRAVMDNLGLVAKWNIQGYPYLVYRGKDGRIKIVQGRPERMAAVLTDIIP